MYRFILLLTVLTLAACNKVHIPENESRLVVEGWIEDGRFPVVLVTSSVPVSLEPQELENLEDHIVRWAKVSVNDGEKEIIMAGGPDNSYFPPYSYTTARMRGKAGGTYELKVEYQGQTVTSVTTIPAKKSLEYLRVESIPPADTSFRIVAGIRDDEKTSDRYKFFIRKEGKDSSYISSFLGLLKDEEMDDTVYEAHIYNNISVNSSVFEQFFSADDVIYIRFSTLDNTSWEYWNDYDEIQALSRNPFIPSSKKIRTNINGGFGCWAGYGSTYYKVSIPDSLSSGRVFRMQTR